MDEPVSALDQLRACAEMLPEAPERVSLDDMEDVVVMLQQIAGKCTLWGCAVLRTSGEETQRLIAELLRRAKEGQ